LNIVQNFKRTTFVVTQRALVTLFLICYTLLIVYNLNDLYFISKIFSTFQINHIGQYSERIVVFKFKKFYLLVTLFSFFLPFSPFTILKFHIFYKKIIQNFKKGH